MTSTYEIRECNSCGLRYPLTEIQSFGTRCPSCLGETYVVLIRQFESEAKSSIKPAVFHLEAMLDNIRSAWNVGSIFRTADGFGLKHLHLCGITPTPEIDAVKKTSLGAEETVNWSYNKNALRTAQTLKSEGYKFIALEEDKRSVPIQNAGRDTDKVKTVLVAGNEITGVDPDLLDLCDEMLFIPMRGNKRSFNVAVAFAVAAFTLSSQGK
jgi:tRNA G18 (ribose-2'-O)-methylase SpoU